MDSSTGSFIHKSRSVVSRRQWVSFSADDCQMRGRVDDGEPIDRKTKK